MTPRLALAPLFLAALGTVAGAAEPEGFVLPEALRPRAPVCRTDVRGELDKVRRGLIPAAPSSRVATKAPLRTSTVSPAVALLDNGCTGGRCVALACPRDQPRSECWLQYQLAQYGSDRRVYQVDTFAAANRFYAAYPDTATAGWDEVVFFSTFLTTTSGGAYYAPVANDVSGISRVYLGARRASDERYDTNDYRGTGSKGFLKGTVLMSEWHTCLFARIARMPCSLSDLSQNGVLGVLGQEVGHRWGAFLHFEEAGSTSAELVGRDRSHWSYYVHSDGSPLEGNRWVEQPGGGWRLAEVEGLQFSPMDLYTMGALAPEEVPPTVLIRSPQPAACPGDQSVPPGYNDNCTNAATPPASGVTRLTGKERLVTVDEIVAAEGRRLPAFPDAPRRVYLAFVLLDEPGAPATEDEQRTLDGLRRTFTRGFYDGTNRRMRAITTLSRADDLGLYDFTLDTEGWVPSRELAVLDGRVVFPLSGSTTLTHERLELDAAREKVLQLRVSTTRLADVTLVLRWSSEAKGEWNETRLALPATGATTSVQVPMEGLPGWTGLIRRMELEVVPVSAPPTGEVSIDRLETFARAPEADQDGDQVPDAEDNCPARPNTSQLDADANGAGDACDEAGGGGDAPDGCGCSGALPLPAALLCLGLRRRRAKAACRLGSDAIGRAAS
jgi:hypothetical protein